MNWNVIVTVRSDFDRALGILRKLGKTERTGLYNVLVMSVPDVRGFLDRIAQAEDSVFPTISHVVPITDKIAFTSAEDFERKAGDVLRGWLPQLAGKSLHVRMRRRGGDLHCLALERRLAGVVLDELARRGTPGRIALDDPDAVISIETIRDAAGLALWTRVDLDRYPFLRASIERGDARLPSPAPPESAPSRSMLAATARYPAASRPATRAELVDLLGELEPLTLDRLVATGATIGEVAEAVSAIEDECGEIHHSPSSPREADVRAILEDLLFEDFEEAASEREIART